MNFTALQHSPLLVSLGWAIASSLWQAAVLWILYNFINTIYKEASSKFKNNLSTLLLATAFVWFCTTLLNKYFVIQSNNTNYLVQSYDEKNIIAITSYNWADVVNKISVFLPYLSIAYLLLLVFLSLRLINIYRFTRFIKYNGLQKPGVEWKLFADKVAKQIGIKKKIMLWVSHHIDVPATIGFIKPVILIPLASINQLSSDQLEAIILHELSHIKRNDYLINLFIAIVETILFFNPFIVLLSKIIKKERENCCDDFVIQYKYDRYAYASALLSLEQCRNINIKLAIGATSGKKQLMIRIKRIMEVNNTANFNYGQKLIALLLVTAIVCSIAWLSPQRNNRNQLSERIENEGKRKINSFEKWDASLSKQIDDKIITVFNKNATKTAWAFLKKLKNINLKNIPGIDSKNISQPVTEREVADDLFKINNAEKIFTSGAIASPALGKDSKVKFPFDFTLINGKSISPQSKIIDLQKLQEQLDKSQFAFSFDQDRIKNAFKQAVNFNQLQSLLDKYLNDIELKKIVDEKMNHSPQHEKIVKQIVLLKHPPKLHLQNEPLFYFFDSPGSSEIESANKVMRAHNKEFINEDLASENITADNSEAKVYSYSFRNKEDCIIATITNKKKKLSQISLNKHELTSPVIATSPVIVRFANPRVPEDNIDPAKTNIQKSKKLRNNNIRIEYNNGVVVINGQQIKLPNNEDFPGKFFAQFSAKHKRAASEKDVQDMHLND